jgi:hypothetical protein
MNSAQQPELDKNANQLGPFSEADWQEALAMSSAVYMAELASASSKYRSDLQAISGTLPPSEYRLDPTPIRSYANPYTRPEPSIAYIPVHESHWWSWWAAFFLALDTVLVILTVIGLLAMHIPKGAF